MGGFACELGCDSFRMRGMMMSCNSGGKASLVSASHSMVFIVQPKGCPVEADGF